MDEHTSTETRVRRDAALEHIDGAAIDGVVAKLLGGDILVAHWREGPLVTLFASKTRAYPWDLQIASLLAACSPVEVDSGLGRRTEVLLYVPKFVAELIVARSVQEHLMEGERGQICSFASTASPLEAVAAALAALHLRERRGHPSWELSGRVMVQQALRMADAVAGVCARTGCSPAALVELGPDVPLSQWDGVQLERLEVLAATAFAPAV